MADLPTPALPTADEFFAPKLPAPPPGAPPIPVGPVPPVSLGRQIGLMTAALPLVGSASPAPPPPTADQFFGPRKPTDVSAFAANPEIDDEFLAHSGLGWVLDHFGQGAKDAWGAEPLGLSPETEKSLRDVGLFNDYVNGRTSLMRSFNEQLIRPAVTAADAAMRAVSAGVRGVSEVAVAAGLPRDLTPQAMWEAFPVGHFTGFPVAVPQPNAFAYKVDDALTRLTARARDLGVIGKGEAGWKGFPTAADDAVTAAEAARRLNPTGIESPTEQVLPPTSLTMEEPGPPDIHAVARQIAPDTFAEYDALSGTRDALTQRLDELGGARSETPEALALQAQMDTIMARVHGREIDLTTAAQRRYNTAYFALNDLLTQDTAEMADLRQQRQRADEGMRDLATQVSEAYRQAQERMPPAEAPEAPAAAQPGTEAPAAGAPAATVPDSVLIAFPDMTPTHENAYGLNYFSADEQRALEVAGLVKQYTTEQGVTYRGVDAETLWELRKQRQAERGPGAPAAAPPIDDPLAMQRRGELTAARAGEIRDELARTPPAAGAADHLDPEIWKVVADNLGKAEASREGGVSVVADQMRYLPDDGVPKNISEREAVAVIGRAMDAEAARGGDLAAFRADADAAYRAKEGGTPPDLSAAEAARAATHPYATVEIRPNPGGGFDVETPLEGIQYAATMEEAQRIAARYTRLTGEQAARYDAATGRNYGDDWRNNQVDAGAAATAQREAPYVAPGAAPAAPPLEGGIAGDVERTLVALGRPVEVARAEGIVRQARYEARAAAFGGTKGTAEDLYRAASTVRAARGVPAMAQRTRGARELGQRGVDDTVKADNAIESARTDQGQALPGRVPTGRNAPANRLTDADAIPDLATLESNPELFQKNVDAIGADPGLGHNGGPPLESGLPREFPSARAKAEYLIGRLKDNLLWLYDQVPAAIRDRSQLWYDGGQAIATEWADRWGLTRSQTAGILAVLSPQKDWFMNTTMAERVGDILHRFADHRWGAAMDAQAFKFLVGETSTSVENRAAYDAIKGKTLREVVATGDPVQTGMWIRAYDEAHHGAAHAIITPEGAYAGNMLTQAGDEARRAWGDFGAIGKAASIFMDGSPENVSRQLGTQHKVRNFYNNLFNASDPRYVTIDTHAVAADELRPLAGKDKAVLDNFRTTGTDRATGIQGSYALHAEAYRRAAAERGILPREMQSVTWEAVRGLFPDTWKTEANKLAVDAIWNRVGIGELSAEDARAQIHELAGGIRPPEWIGHDTASMVDRTSTYAGTREPPAGGAINFEVAPDPRNATLVARWNAVSQAVRDEISHSVAWKTAKSALEGAGEALWGRTGSKQLPVALKAELHRNNGGWLNDSNPSLTLQFDPNVAPAKIGIVSRLMGYALRQQETLRHSPRSFRGGEETGAIKVQLPRDATPADIHAVYQQIRELKDAKGEPYVIGHTTGPRGDMVILNNNDRATIGTPELARLINEKLGGRYNMDVGPIYAERVQAGSNDYGYQVPQNRRGVRGEPGPEPSLRRAGDNLRAEAQQHLEDQLTAYEGRAAEPGPGAEPGPTGEPRAAGEPGAPRGPPAELEQARRAKIRLATETTRAQVTLGALADESSLIHEWGHEWLEELKEDAADPRAPAWLKADWQSVSNWLGLKEGEAIPTRAHERFARGNERFFMEGHAPTQALAAVFAKFRDWLIRIYQSVDRLNVPLTDEMRGVYGRLLASQREEGAAARVVAPEREMAPAAPRPGISAVDHLAELVGVDARDYTPEQIAQMASGVLSPEELARQIGGLEATAEHDVAEGERRTGPIEGAPASEAVYGDQLKTEEELGRERDAATQTAADTLEGAGGAGAPGRPAGSEGVLPERAGEGRTGAPTAGRTSTSPSEAPAAPNAAFGPSDGRLIDKAGNIRLDNLNAPEDVEQVIRDAAERNAGFIDARRGVITDGQMQDLADALGKDPSFLEEKKIGQAFSAEEIRAATKLLVESATAVRDAMARAASGTDADVAAMAQAIIRHEMIQAKVAQATAEWGRAGRAFRAIDGWEGARDLNQLLKDNTGRTLNQLRQMAKLGQSLNTPAQVSKLVADTAGGKVRQAIVYYWVNTLISGPITHLTYSVGNAINALWTPLVETPIAATSGAVREALGMPAQDRVYFNEVTSQLYGLGKGFRDGLGAALEAAKSGVSPALPGERIPAQFLTPIQSPIPGVVGQAIGVPGRAVSAIHSFFKTLRYEQNIQALAMRDALDAGLTGDARDLHVARLTATPTEAMMESAVADALKELYMRRQGFNSPMALVTRGVNGFLPAKIMLPFIKIGSEIVRNAFMERTLLGLGSTEVRGNLFLREGGAAFDQQLGKIMAGTGLMAAITIGVLEGNVTGDGPADPNERRIWLLSHKPNSITVGPLSFSYARLGHLGMLTRFAANMTETSQRWNDEQGAQLARAFFEGITRSVLDETWMRGLKDALDAVYHMEEHFDNWVTRFVAQWTPASIGMGQVARAIDPYQRETRDLSTAQEILNQIKSHTPLWSQSLPPRRDMFGEPITTGSGTVDRYANDRVTQAMDELHIGIAQPKRDIRGVPLTAQQYDDVARIGGRLAKMELDAVVPSLGYMPPVERIKTIKLIVEHNREAAATQVMIASIGGPNDIMAKSTDSKAAAAQGASPLEVKEKLKAR